MEQVVDSTNHQAQVQHLHYLPNVNVSLSLPDLLLECVLAVQIARRYVREDLLGITDDDLRRIIQKAEAAECDGEEDVLVLSSDATIARRGTNDDNANNNHHITGKEDVSLSRKKEEKKDFTNNGRASEAIKKLISSRLGIQTKGALAHKKEKEEAFDMVTTADKIAQEVIQRILIVRFSEQAVAEDEMWATGESKTAITMATTTTPVSSAACENVTAEKTIGHFPRLVEIAKRVCYDFEAGRRLPTPPSVRAKWVQQQQQQQHFQRHEQQGGSAPPSSSVTKADNNVNGDDKTQKTKQELCDAAAVNFSLLDLLPFTLIGEEETSRFVAVDDGSILSFSPLEFKAKRRLFQEGPLDRAAPKEDRKDDENPKTGGSLDEQVQCALSKCVNIYLPETLRTISSLSQTRCGTEGIFSVLCGAADRSSDAASLALEELIPHFAKFRKYIEEKFYHRHLNPQTSSSEPRAPLNCPLIIKACHKAEYKENTETLSSINIDNESDNKNSRFGLINSKIRNSKATDEPFKLFPPFSFSPSTSSSSSQGVVDTANENNNQGAAASNISPSSFGMFVSLLDLSNGRPLKTASTTASQEKTRDDVTILYAQTPQIADDVSLGDVFLSESDSVSLIPPYTFPLRIIERQALIRYLTVHEAQKERGQKGEDNKEQYLSSQVFDVERFDSLCGFDTTISFSAMLMSSSAQKAKTAAAAPPPPRFMVLPLLVGTPDEIKKCDGGDDAHFSSSLSSTSSCSSLLQKSLKAFDQLLDAFEKKDLSVLTQRHRSLVAETFMATRFVNLYTTLVLPDEELGKGAKEARKMSSMRYQSVYDKLDALLTAYVVHRQRQFLRSLLRQRVCVIIDPIDGTNAFTQGDRHAPMTLVGVAVDGEPVIGVTNRILSEKNSVAAAAGDKEEDALHVDHVHEAVAVKGKVDGTADMEMAVRRHLPIVGSSTAELLRAIANEYRREINTFIGDHHHAAEPSVSLSSSKVDCRDEFMELVVPTFPETVDGHRAKGGGELELVAQKQTSQDGEGKTENDKKVSSLLPSFNQEGGRKGYGTPAAWPFAHYFRDNNENANINNSSNSRNNSTTTTLSSKANLMGQMIESVRIPREPLSYCLTSPSSSSSCVSSLSHCVIDGEWIDVEARQQLALRQCMALLPCLLAEDEETCESAESGGNEEKTTENENTSLIAPSKIKLSDLYLVASVSSTTSAKALHTVSTIVSPFAPLPDRGAGNKLLAVTKGLSDTMVAPPNTIHKWDTLAPHAFLRSVGGDIVEAREGVSVVYPATHAAANAIFEAKREAVISNICVQFPCDAVELTSLPSGVVACQSTFIRSIVLRRIQNEKRHAFQQWLKGQKEDDKL